MQKIKFFHLFLALGSILLIMQIINMADKQSIVSRVQAANPTTNEAIAPNCRYGASSVSGSPTWLSTLGAGWYINFGPNPSSQAPANVSHTPIIRIREKKVWDETTQSYDFLGEWYLQFDTNITGADAENFVRTTITNYPGRLWIIGNEIDRLTQDEITPELYASAYHDIYGWIKDEDPTAQVAISGLVEVTPLRLAYLDRIWDAYLTQFNTPIPVDVWNLHIYILPEVAADGVTPSAASIPVGIDLSQTTAVPKREGGGNPNNCSDPDVYCFAEHDDMDIFEQQIRDMRTWMRAHGEQNKPLILSEFSQLWPYEDDGATCYLQDEYGNCFTPARVSAFMLNSYNKLNNLKDANLGYPLDENRLVQQWMWFSIYTGDPNIAGGVSDLIQETSPGSGTFILTQVGQQFQSYVANESTYTNLLAERAEGEVLFTNPPTSTTVTATLSLRFRNTGNTFVEQPVYVTFYEDEDLTIPIDTVTTTVTVEGCAVRFYDVTVSWPNLSPGTHRFWAKVDSGNGVVEDSEADNVQSGVVLVDPLQVFLPVIQR